ncbi:aa3-type cytochrome c oxidase subunit IV [Sphingomicrobium nitratireducens]|nr:aa3-type cytochrome c oxidase subunit IV [Sphingomicrobium nitratireducens]
MADSKAHPTATEMDYPAHEKNYSGFLKLLKFGIVATAIITAIVIYVIAN